MLAIILEERDPFRMRIGILSHKWAPQTLDDDIYIYIVYINTLEICGAFFVDFTQC